MGGTAICTKVFLVPTLSQAVAFNVLLVIVKEGRLPSSLTQNFGFDLDFGWATGLSVCLGFCLPSSVRWLRLVIYLVVHKVRTKTKTLLMFLLLFAA
jgi:hypothetical protein